MNVWDILILLAVAGAAALALRFMRRRKKAGCSGCCTACGQSCPYKEKAI